VSEEEVRLIIEHVERHLRREIQELHRQIRDLERRLGNVEEDVRRSSR
jgi:hypothetical protein